MRYPAVFWRTVIKPRRRGRRLPLSFRYSRRSLRPARAHLLVFHVVKLMADAIAVVYFVADAYSCAYDHIYLACWSMTRCASLDESLRAHARL